MHSIFQYQYNESLYHCEYIESVLLLLMHYANIIIIATIVPSHHLLLTMLQDFARFNKSLRYLASAVNGRTIDTQEESFFLVE